VCCNRLTKRGLENGFESSIIFFSLSTDPLGEGRNSSKAVAVNGKVAEWSNALDSKSSVRLGVP
jgi:hypothetical protein